MYHTAVPCSSSASSARRVGRSQLARHTCEDASHFHGSPPDAPPPHSIGCAGDLVRPPVRGRAVALLLQDRCNGLREQRGRSDDIGQTGPRHKCSSGGHGRERDRPRGAAPPVLFGTWGGGQDRPWRAEREWAGGGGGKENGKSEWDWEWRDETVCLTRLRSWLRRLGTSTTHCTATPLGTSPSERSTTRSRAARDSSMLPQCVC
jgi:hypothetical protein